ncbi:putative potassium channel, voltage-dependent, EAG/ELK/ERG, rmlC-like jelly roll [Helianthus annuus]|uniref:Potassium channel, voltage-dependent, EAG/ELK/ERG, rmlC-like jelly roll n=1 Tax=Helianthus annuus TaxID=4232 RepID=A0A251UE92_HELAN|nr:cyclic nucleotide-gated ion channel 1 [Helianthus annuus]XP_035831348.1 cyclic nucleotide-gated ion channel 1 [Helianthus annuus]XP_035831349.1 cyclic nucleotide-gated ion channel 1 [Helianthus annuus]KAF5800519.1 putative potassium channel, voltage-dependent, EAG/ELK/ERG, rmlC-like jelly roll [Helianthus annuus]
MNEKFVRFEDWKSERSSNGGSPKRFKTALGSVSSMFRKSFEHGSGGVKSLKRTMGTHPLNRILSRGLGSGKKTLNPQGKFLQKWNKIFVLSCLIAVSVDPLFFYIPIVKEDNKCLDLDSKLQITASVLRSFTDIFYIVHIIFQFRTGFIPPSSRVFGRGVLVEDAWEIAKRYLSSYFLVDILAVLPLPQVVIWIIIPKLRGSKSLNTKNLLKFIVFFQYIPRMLRIYPLYKEVTRTSGILTETAWAGAAFNLFLYMLASHVFGAFWYLSSIERETTCWRKACGNITATFNANVSECVHSSFYCDSTPQHVAYLNASCPIIEMENPPYDFGIFLPALASGVVNSTDFPQKFFYCFWWGLQNLSSLGQNLKTSTFVWEICFAVFISISGLVLFSFLIGNMQTYLQSTTIRLEEMRVKRRDAEQWMSHRLLPEHLKERIRRYEQYKWQETRGVDEDNLIRNLPKDLRRDIKRHLCLKLLKRVPMFEKMDDQLMDAMCDRLKPVLYTEKSYIVREGDPVDEMHFVMRGKLLTVTTNGGRTGFFNSEELKAGDFCGEELLTWALDPHTSSNLPISTRTVQALEEVEAFALMADDLKFVASQFRRLHSKQLRHTFRFYSQQWRTWAACFIQAAWRRHCRKKLEDSLREEEDRLQSALTGAGGSSPSLGATIYASRFAANALRALRRNGARKGRIPEKIPPLMLQKPAEPDFTAED